MVKAFVRNEKSKFLNRNNKNVFILANKT